MKESKLKINIKLPYARQYGAQPNTARSRLVNAEKMGLKINLAIQRAPIYCAHYFFLFRGPSKGLKRF